ncbi:hypothetical protein B0J13DRAFT_642473 [Dactylonectria estremocensis]|uniref:Uncharacterized protein n=1 Tax=Dactylonectria estremocensis TaxID=1079267 RepID=A0A9P9E810_9HYPO|nr:hypothetical protein B0J13DRAFT_642473 [Dactylonectria estremocensis]
MSSAASVYEGFWTDHDHGGLSSARLTLDAYNAALLIAFIAIFVTICGDRMWSAVQFVLHQLRAGAKQRGEDDENLQLLITGRREVKTICYDAVLAFLALFNFVAWTAAGVLSAWVAVSNNPLIHVSPDCGFYADPSDAVSFTPAAGFQARLLNSSRTADEYVQTCYNTSSSSNSLCQQFVQQEIRWTGKSNATCPFASGMCLGGDNAAFEMDSGMIDSHDTLGINAAKENRVQYRRKSTCAPVVTRDPYAELIPGRYPGEEYALYHYGDTLSTLNYTYLLSTYAQRGPAGYILRYIHYHLPVSRPRQLTLAPSSSGVSAPGGFMPIPEIARSDAEVTLFFLVQNLLAYTAPVDDLFFAAHTRPTIYELTHNDDPYTFYYNDKIVPVMGCIDQHQICKLGSAGEGTNCSALSSMENLQSEVAKLELNQVQHDTAYVIQWEILGGEMLNSIAGRGAVALKAQRMVFDNINIPLPDNQWTLEVGGWFSIALARLQHAIVEYSTGPAHTDSGRYQRYTASSLSRIYTNTCNSQKGRQLTSSISYLTFNVVGLLVISVVGIFVILLNPVLVLIVGLRRSGKWSQRHREWKLHSEFQRVASQSSQLTSPRPGASGFEPSSPPSQEDNNGRLVVTPPHGQYDQPVQLYPVARETQEPYEP